MGRIDEQRGNVQLVASFTERSGRSPIYTLDAGMELGHWLQSICKASFAAQNLCCMVQCGTYFMHSMLITNTLSKVVHMVIAFLHFVEIASPYVPGISSPILRRYPDLFAVLTVLLCTPTFSVIWLWAAKRQLEVGFACGIDIVGMQRRNKSQASRREEKKNA